MPGNVVSATLRSGLFTRVVGKRILFFQEVPSTMDEAARLAASGTCDGTVVVASSQTAGRGRQGRSWVSQTGNLYVSIVFRPSMPALPMLSILAGVAAARSIRKTTGLDPRIKWPNDVMLGRKKVGGILVESVVQGQTVDYAIVGIGLNISLETQSDQEIASFATSLNQAAGRTVAPEDVLRQLLQDLDSLYLQLGQAANSPLIDSPLIEWKTLLDTLGQRVEVTWGKDRITGLAEDVDDLGNLMLRRDDGRLVTLTAGDVTLGSSA